MLYRFRWVYCQIAYLRCCLPGRIRQALAELPETLDETYERTLQRINEANWEFAHRLFQFVSVASRPLRVEELAELLAFDFKTAPIPSRELAPGRPSSCSAIYMHHITFRCRGKPVPGGTILPLLSQGVLDIDPPR
jgi:hypothetical protein